MFLSLGTYMAMQSLINWADIFDERRHLLIFCFQPNAMKCLFFWINNEIVMLSGSFLLDQTQKMAD